MSRYEKVDLAVVGECQFAINNSEELIALEFGVADEVFRQ